MTSLIVDLVTLVITFGGILIAIMEYKRQGRAKCLEVAITLRDQFRNLYEATDLIEMLESDDQKLRNIPTQLRAQIIAHLEVVEFALRQKSIDEEVAFNFLDTMQSILEILKTSAMILQLMAPSTGVSLLSL